jgi:hypothetical protein
MSDKNADEVNIRNLWACAGDVTVSHNTKSKLKISNKLICWSKLIKELLHSHQFHKAIVMLVIIDCLCVAVELIIEHIDVYVLGYDGDKKILENTISNSNRTIIFDTILNSTSIDFIKQNDSNYNLHLFMSVLAKILKIISIIILTVFLIEIVFKLVFLTSIFIRSKLEIFDAFIIILSLAVNFYLLFNKKLVMSIGGLLTLFRLWRITEIVNGKFK